MTTRAARLAAVAAIWSDLEQEYEGRVEPSPKYSRDRPPSQYPEGVVAVSGGPTVDDEFERRLRQLTHELPS